MNSKAKSSAEAITLGRRQFVKFLAASPIFAGLSPSALLGDELSSVSGKGIAGMAAELFSLITSPDQAQDVFDFERVAEQVLPPAHWAI